MILQVVFNSDLVGKTLVFTSRGFQMLEKKLGSQLCELDDEGKTLVKKAQQQADTIANFMKSVSFQRLLLLLEVLLMMQISILMSINLGIN